MFRGSAKRVFAVLVAVSTVVAFSACGTTSEGSDRSAESAESGAFPVTLTTTFGEVTVESQPTRVVALGWGDAETALALGVQPVGASDWLDHGGTGVGPWAQDRYTNPPTLVGTTSVDFEKIAALNPDVILNTSAEADKQRHRTLSEIAPVISPPPDTLPYGTSWRKQVTTVAKALGKTSKSEQLIAETEAAFSKAQQAHPEFRGKTVALGSQYSGQFAAYVSGDSRVEFMKELGFVNKPAIDKLAGGNFHITVSPERLDLLSADLTVMFPIRSKAEQLRQNKLLNELPSAEAGHLVILDDPALISAFSSGSVLAIRYALEHAVPLFAQALNS